jgi:hypothetical protein
MAARAELAGTAFIPFATRADRQGESASRRCLREDRRQRSSAPGAGFDHQAGWTVQRHDDASIHWPQDVPELTTARLRLRAVHPAHDAAGMLRLLGEPACHRCGQPAVTEAPKPALAALLPPGRHPLPRKSCASIAARTIASNACSNQTGAAAFAPSMGAVDPGGQRASVAGTTNSIERAGHCGRYVPTMEGHARYEYSTCTGQICSPSLRRRTSPPTRRSLRATWVPLLAETTRHDDPKNLVRAFVELCDF